MKTRIKIVAAIAALAALPAVLLAQQATPGAATGATAATTPTTAGPHRHGRHDLFKLWDTNGDGQITRDEAQAAAAAMAAKRFDKLDLNKDGVLTREEVQQAWQARRAEFKQKFEAKFKAADTNGDGGLSKAETTAAFPRLARHFDQLDLNHDGILTLDELQAARHRHGGAAPAAPTAAP